MLTNHSRLYLSVSNRIKKGYQAGEIQWLKFWVSQYADEGLFISKRSVSTIGKEKPIDIKKEE